MEYVYCTIHPNQILWVSTDGHQCCVCVHEASTQPEESKWPQCESCGIHYDPENSYHVCKGIDSKKFHAATFFTCDDEGGELAFTCWTEAIAEIIDNASHEFVDGKFKAKAIPIDQVIADMTPLTVYGWNRKNIEKSFGSVAIDSMLERLDEDWQEEYGSPDAYPCVFDAEERRGAEVKFQELLHQCLIDTKPWQCENVAKMVFDEVEVTTLMKEHSPEWWDADV